MEDFKDKLESRSFGFFELLLRNTTATSCLSFLPLLKFSTVKKRGTKAIYVVTWLANVLSKAMHGLQVKVQRCILGWVHFVVAMLKIWTQLKPVYIFNFRLYHNLRFYLNWERSWFTFFKCAHYSLIISYLFVLQFVNFDLEFKQTNLAGLGAFAVIVQSLLSGNVEIKIV